MIRRSFRVMIDARMLLGRFSGVARVVTRLIDELSRQDGIAIVALCGETVDPLLSARPNVDVRQCDFGRRDRRTTRRVLWDELKLPRIIRSAGVDVFHATWNFGIPARCPVPSVLTIHDLIPWSDRNAIGVSLPQRLAYRYAIDASAQRAARITTVSAYSRGQVIEKLHVDPVRVSVVPNGADLPVRLREQLTEPPGAGPRTCHGACAPCSEPPDTGYVLYVGGHEPRKNVAGILRAMRLYWQRYGPTLELCLTGREESLCAEARTVWHTMPAGAPVRFLGDVDDGRLADLYGSARLLLMLSYEEGFGLPVLEAMACGCPVVAANRTALPEVVGDAAVLVDPERPQQAVEAIRTVAVESPERAGLVKRGHLRAQAFTWAAAAERMRAVYEGVLCGAYEQPAQRRRLQPVG